MQIRQADAERQVNQDDVRRGGPQALQGPRQVIATGSQTKIPPAVQDRGEAPGDKGLLGIEQNLDSGGRVHIA